MSEVEGPEDGPPVMHGPVANAPNFVKLEKGRIETPDGRYAGRIKLFREGEPSEQLTVYSSHTGCNVSIPVRRGVPSEAAIFRWLQRGIDEFPYDRSPTTQMKHKRNTDKAFEKIACDWTDPVDDSQVRRSLTHDMVVVHYTFVGCVSEYLATTQYVNLEPWHTSSYHALPLVSYVFGELSSQGHVRTVANHMSLNHITSYTRIRIRIWHLLLT
eukprot:4489380-Pyramimonas_sp.AAC.1